VRARLVAAAAALAAVAALAVVAGCSQAATGTATDRPPSKVGSAAPAPTSPMITLTAPAGTPLGAGQRVWAAFSQRGLPYDAWWAQLAPLLSPAARAVYVYDDPRKIPAMTLTGPIRSAAKPPAEARYTAEVLVPTSKGVFGLDLERHRIGSPWLLYAIKFPPGVQ